MIEASTDQLKQAVESQHGGIATLLQSVPLDETFFSDTVWKGVVHIFRLAGNPKATRVYAWSYQGDDGKRRFVTVLHAGSVTNPREAVRTAIVAEARGKT